MNGGTTSEVNYPKFVEPTAGLRIEIENPVGYREVDKYRPDTGKNEPGAELGSISDRTGDQTHRDAGKHGLESHETHGRNSRLRIIGHQPLEPRELGDVAKETSVAIRRCKCHRIAD